MSVAKGFLANSLCDQVWLPMVMPAAATIFEMSGRQVACSPISKNVPLTHMSVSALITIGVFSGHGPSSKVSTTSFSRRKSYCLKCSVPNAGPPVVSISTVRARPMPSGLSQVGALFAGDGAGAALLCGAAAAAGAGVGAGVFWATTIGGAATGATDGAATAGGATTFGFAASVAGVWEISAPGARPAVGRVL